MKTIVASILGIVVGVVVGAGGIHQWLMPRLAEAELALKETQRSLASLQSESGSALDKLARLEQERERYGERLDAAEARAAAAEARASALPAVTSATPAMEVDAPVTDAAPGEEPRAREDDDDEGEGRRGRGRDRERDGDRDNPWGGTEEERAARRQEFVTRMQDNMTSFFTGELEKSSTPQMEQRLVALEEKTYEMFELRSQMRRAETDEERQALGQAFGDTMAAARQLMVEQQQDMIGAIASQFGISKVPDQAAFEQAVRSAIDSPFFSDNPGSLLWSAGRPDDGGGDFSRFGGGFRGGGPGGGRR